MEFKLTRLNDKSGNHATTIGYYPQPLLLQKTIKNALNDKFTSETFNPNPTKLKLLSLFSCLPVTTIQIKNRMFVIAFQWLPIVAFVSIFSK